MRTCGAQELESLVLELKEANNELTKKVRDTEERCNRWISVAEDTFRKLQSRTTPEAKDTESKHPSATSSNTSDEVARLKACIEQLTNATEMGLNDNQCIKAMGIVRQFRSDVEKIDETERLHKDLERIAAEWKHLDKLDAELKEARKTNDEQLEKVSIRFRQLGAERHRISRKLEENSVPLENTTQIDWREVEIALISMGFTAEEIRLENTSTSRVGGSVISERFLGKSQVERQETLWANLAKHLAPEKCRLIVSILTMTPNEIDDRFIL
jgi:acid stress-induced BolA-like protein IbaG/YrbA